MNRGTLGDADFHGQPEPTGGSSHHQMKTRFARPDCPIAVQPELPHIRIHVGTDGVVFIMCALDSCGALNLGDYAYHARVKELYPETVQEFKEWEALTDMERLQLFGVSNEDAKSVEISHVIRYKTPFIDNGKMFLLTFGLSSTSSCTALVGIPFHIESRLKADYGEKQVYIPAFDKTYNLEFHVPSLRTPPARKVGNNIPTTLVGTQPDQEDRGVRFSIGSF